MLTLDDLHQPAADICLKILRERLKEVLAQGARLHRDSADEEALHDARVAVRRTRVWLRLCKGCVELPRKSRRILRAFARESSPVRDLEVQEAWLAGLGVRGGHRPGWLALRGRLANAHAERRQAVLASLPELIEGAQRAVDHMRASRDACDEPFGSWMAGHWMDASERYLAEIHHLPEGLHPLRLVGKQLRYMLEPMVDALGAADVLRELRRGQDATGRVNDAGVLAAALPAHVGALLGQQIEENVRFAMEMRVAPRWSSLSHWSGLRAVSQALVDEEVEALAALHGWRLAAGDALAEALPRIGVQLAGSAAFDGFGNPV